MNHHHHHSADDESAPLLLGQKTTATASILQEEDSDIERYMAMNVKERGKQENVVCDKISDKNKLSVQR
jgi:hypothetical protein